jgi:hypothetical protein
MKRISLLLGIVVAGILLVSSGTMAMEAKLAAKSVKAGAPVTVTGKIDPGKDLYLVISSDKMFKPEEAPGPKERKRLTQGKNGKNAFAGVEIPPTYYVVTNVPDTLATVKNADKGQTKGIFAFPPFKYKVKVNKIKKWDTIDPAVQAMLVPIKDAKQWDFLIFTHEKKFGINTIAKEKPIGGGNARMVLTAQTAQPEAWNKGVSLKLDKNTGEFAVTLTPYKTRATNTVMAVYVNGQKADTFSI